MCVRGGGGGPIGRVLPGFVPLGMKRGAVGLRARSLPESSCAPPGLWARLGQRAGGTQRGGGVVGLGFATLLGDAEAERGFRGAAQDLGELPRMVS